MRLDVIDNCGATSMIAELRKELETCRCARMATASLTRSGIGFIEEALHEGPSTLRIRLLVGLYNGHTESAALRQLLGLQRKHGQKIEIRIAENQRFHWKTYLFESRGRFTAFVGSSNLTKDGLGLEGEFNIRLESKNASGTLAHLVETFDRVWDKQSIPLSIGIAERFSSASNQWRELARNIDPIIKEILRRPRRKRTIATPKDSSIMTSIEEIVCRATVKVVKDRTDWYRRGWLWMVCRQKSRSREAV